MEENNKQNSNTNENNKPKENVQNTEKKITKTKKTRRLIVLIFLAIAIIVTYTIYRGEYLETLELGEQYLSVFWQNLIYEFATFGISFVIIYFLIYMTNIGMKKGLTPFFEQEKKQMPKIPNKSISFILALVISFFGTNIIMEKLMLFFNSTAFEITDPVLGYDIGYFIFGQPFIKLIIQYALFIAVGLAIYTVVYYIISFNVYFEGVDRQALRNSRLIKQLCKYVLIIAVLIAGYIFIETHNVGLQRFVNLNQITNSDLYGAGISEVTIKSWGYRFLSIIIIISVFLAERAFKKQNTKNVILSLSIVPIYLVAMLVVLLGFELIFVNSNELDKQQAYIQDNIENTKQAYGINIEEVNLGENETITTETLNQNQTVVNNITIVNEDTVLKN